MRSSDANRLVHPLPLHPVTNTHILQHTKQRRSEISLHVSKSKQGYLNEAHGVQGHSGGTIRIKQVVGYRGDFLLRSTSRCSVISKESALFHVSKIKKNTDAVPLFIITKKEEKKKKKKNRRRRIEVSFGNVLQYRERIRRFVHVSPLVYVNAPSWSVYA